MSELNKKELDALTEDIKTNKLSAKTKKTMTKLLKIRLLEVNRQITEAEAQQKQTQEDVYEIPFLVWIERNRKSSDSDDPFWTEHWLIDVSGRILAKVTNPYHEDLDGPYIAEIVESEDREYSEAHFLGESDAKRWCEEIISLI